MKLETLNPKQRLIAIGKYWTLPFAFCTLLCGSVIVSLFPNVDRIDLLQGNAIMGSFAIISSCFAYMILKIVANSQECRMTEAKSIPMKIQVVKVPVQPVHNVYNTWNVNNNITKSTTNNNIVNRTSNIENNSAVDAHYTMTTNTVNNTDNSDNRSYNISNNKTDNTSNSTTNNIVKGADDVKEIKPDEQISSPTPDSNTMAESDVEEVPYMTHEKFEQVKARYNKERAQLKLDTYSTIDAYIKEIVAPVLGIDAANTLCNNYREFDIDSSAPIAEALTNANIDNASLFHLAWNIGKRLDWDGKAIATFAKQTFARHLKDATDDYIKGNLTRSPNQGVFKIDRPERGEYKFECLEELVA